ncbi:MAG: dethiobiotin synthase [Deltaproteobacteria bacterium]|nr:dethiobiotin synthase [Deltaproteobacteria bacterium]
MTHAIFVSGTDTEVGKTVVTRGIVRALVRQGAQVAVAKPVESGAELVDGELVPADATALLEAARSDEPIAEVCAYRFPDPVSPHLAAARVGAEIDGAVILKLLEWRADGSPLSIAEGAGGLLVPLADDLLYADVVARSGYGLVIVAPNVLGTINATLLTVEAARSRGIDVVGVVLNQTPAAELGNAEAIAAHGRVPILGQFPTCADPDDDEALADLAEHHLDLAAISGGLGTK